MANWFQGKQSVVFACSTSTASNRTSLCRLSLSTWCQLSFKKTKQFSTSSRMSWVACCFRRWAQRLRSKIMQRVQHQVCGGDTVCRIWEVIPSGECYTDSWSGVDRVVRTCRAYRFIKQRKEICLTNAMVLSWCQYVYCVYINIPWRR